MLNVVLDVSVRLDYLEMISLHDVMTVNHARSRNKSNMMQYLALYKRIEFINV